MILIVGAGISGLVLAERFANAMNERVVIIEKRPHLGGNCHDYINAAGHLVPSYGPHFFHTNSETAWSYLSRFTGWHAYEHRVLSKVDGKLVPVPVNIHTVNLLFGLDMRNEEQMRAWLKTQAEPIENPRNSEESAVSRVGRVLYEKMFKNYTKKQWDLYPHELDALVMNRIPVRTDFDDRYFTDVRQAMPAEGYTKLFERMTANPLIELRLGTNYFDIKDSLPVFDRLFFTGRIDEYFPRQEAKLQYRSLRFEHETLDTEWFQPTGTVNYPNEEAFTRISEPKRSTGQSSPTTTIIREFPTWDGEPYYPVFNPQNTTIYNKYKEMASIEEQRGIHFVGRLANYKYFNMDQAVENSLTLFEQLQS